MITFKNISKRFGKNAALNDINFEIKKGEIHALLGENGAGKSTLLNILHGIYSEFSGNVEIDGVNVRFKNATEAIDAGISKVHQEVMSVTELSAGQNIALGYEPKKGFMIDYDKLYSTTDIFLERLGCKFNSRSGVKNLSVGEVQMIAIAKALYQNAKIISFDEPTSALSDKEVETLLGVIKELKNAGITILYVTHRLDEVFKIADRATILRDGGYVGIYDIDKITKQELINNMVGRDVSSFAVRKKEKCASDEVVLKVENLSLEGVFKDINFELKKGEILSFFGLVGSKRTDVMLTLFGRYKKSGGKIYIKGKEVDITSPSTAVKNCIALIPENRKTQGIVKNFTNEQNMSLASLEKNMKGIFVDRNKTKINAKEKMERLRVHPKDPDYITASLSGGNAQKVIIGKWLSTDSEIIVFDEPTKGIDVGGKAEIYSVMEDLVHQGKSIIMVSSELPEVIGMSDRLIVMREGRKIIELNGANLTESEILSYSMEG
ncbi:sugar ABC transporter ATP-binding protein [Peptoniphilaceae bacterium SGI.131]